MLFARSTTSINSINFYDGIVEIVVGSEGNSKTFRVYKGLLSHYVSYFKGAFGGSFIEAQEGRVVLDEDDPDIFQLVFNFINTGSFCDGIAKQIYGRVYLGKACNELRLCLADELSNSTSRDQPSEVPFSFARLFALYAFADMRGAPQVQDAALSLIAAKLAETMEVPVDELADIQTQLPTNNSLGRIFGELIALSAHPNSVRKYAEFLTAPTLVQCVFRLFHHQVFAEEMKFTRDSSFCTSACEFHEGKCSP